MVQTKLKSDQLMNREVIGGDGGKLGTVKQVYLNDGTGAPEWVTVHTGWFGTRESFIPLAEATEAQGAIKVPYDKDKVKDAPKIDADAHLDQNEVMSLYRHYGLPGGPGQAPGRQSGRREGEARQGEAAPRPQPPAGGKTARGDVARSGGDVEMTRSEERMRVGTEERETGRVRLRKWVETEQVSTTVPVAHEELVIEHEPITEGRPGEMHIGEEEREIILHEERPVVSKEQVPVERVHVGTQKVTGEQEVESEVSREQVEIVDEQGRAVRDPGSGGGRHRDKG
ncbi:PRC and DUF2382 domain-containing protein [Actinomadura macrotermitis]|uniref:DUF2382 domain-containing protein n=1 Tax=Actinomadura macrotermitis TaxID=2585200 RepID=A0A7K0BZI4_9ACTN|nr:hypothetical protein [Actinomadura macrotermitis]